MGWRMAESTGDKQLLEAAARAAGADEIYARLSEIAHRDSAVSISVRAADLRAILALYQQSQAETIAWESTTPVYIQYVTDSRYRKFPAYARKWYRPYRCAACDGRAAAAALCDPHQKGESGGQ
ncbi:hypothetical protein CEY04_23175 [Achromobacter sp. HZ28]|nr:hypothetical protein CEY05_24340 [Achromobacter sp. HZ34]OWT74219.1 hypothetical protein CEY04_23175 [Achromobacter sp. HZ28]